MSIHAYIDPELRSALEAMATANERDLTGEITLALRERCQRNGYWPPPGSAGGTSRSGDAT